MDPKCTISGHPKAHKREPVLSTEGDATCSELMTWVSHSVPAAGSTSLAVMKWCFEGKILWEPVL